MLTIAVKNQDELEQAAELVSQVFFQKQKTQDFASDTVKQWQNDPSYDLDNFITLRTRADKIIGLVQIVPRQLYNYSHIHLVAGFANICLAPEVRGQGYSRALISKTIKTVKSRGFDFALLFSRRILDHYYNKFGFWGASSYNEITIKKHQPSTTENKISYSNARSTDLKFLDLAYKNSYQNVFGRFHREPRYWEYLLNKKMAPKLVVLRLNKKAVAYIAIQSNKICELGTTSSSLYPIILPALFSYLKMDELQFSLSIDHDVLPYFSQYENIITFRESKWGGHMVRILNGPNADNLIHSYEKTLSALEIKCCSQLGVDSNKFRHFNVSVLDQF